MRWRRGVANAKRLFGIFQRLEALKAKGQALGVEREKMEENIAEAEARLDEARRLVEAAEKKLGRDKPKRRRRTISMDAYDESPWDAPDKEREDLLQRIAEMDRAIVECQEARRRTLESLARIDRILGDTSSGNGHG